MVLGFGISLNETLITIHNVALFSISRSLHGYHSITFHDLFNFLSRLLTQMQFDDFLNTLHIYYSTCIGTHVRIQKNSYTISHLLDFFHIKKKLIYHNLQLAYRENHTHFI